mgnify:CR=1 FL=1
MRRAISRRRLSIGGTGALALALILAACSGSPSESTPSASDAAGPSGSSSDAPAEETTTQAPALTGDLAVFAAASLEGVFTELGTLLEEQNPELTVTFNFAASSALAQQVIAGAPADVLATASAATMTEAEAETGEPVTFASNVLVIVTPPDNPGSITGLTDFANADLRIALCAVEVPCGAAADKIFRATGIVPAPDTYEANVTATLNRAVSGEVDAALVYRTDALSAGDTVGSIEFPESADAINNNLIAALTASENPDAAAAFIALVTSPEGQAVLRDAGFTLP